MKTNRRTFIGSGIALAGMAATTGLTSAQDIDAKAGALTKHVLPNLPYGYS